MAKLIYVTNVSLDGFIEDEHGGFGWTQPDDEQFAFVTDLVRPVGTYIYGRRLYESMAVWETDPSLAAKSKLSAEFARVWQAADGVARKTFMGHSDAVMGVAITPDGQTIVSGSKDQTVRIWALAEGIESRTLAGHTDFVHGVALSPDSTLIASASADMTVRLWQLL